MVKMNIRETDCLGVKWFGLESSGKLGNYCDASSYTE
jgi:hypothetical protein